MKSTVAIEGVIGRTAKFYGYIVGLEIERGDLPDSPEVPKRMFARFEYGGRSSVWEVPDSALFGLLAKHLGDNATMRDIHDNWGYSKLWVEWKNGEWDVDLP